MSNGSLRSFVSENKEMATDAFCLLTIDRHLQGLEYLKSNSLIHRDLKPDNILLDNNFVPYISDFELIRHPIEDDEYSNPMTFGFDSQYYTSPEIFSGGEVSYPTDVYSFGMIIYFLYEKKKMEQHHQ